jgi:hypothetical protein
MSNPVSPKTGPVLFVANEQELRRADVVGSCSIAFVRNGNGRVYYWHPGYRGVDDGSNIIVNAHRAEILAGAWRRCVQGDAPT